MLAVVAALITALFVAAQPGWASNPPTGSEPSATSEPPSAEAPPAEAPPASEAPAPTGGAPSEGAETTASPSTGSEPAAATDGASSTPADSPPCTESCEASASTNDDDAGTAATTEPPAVTLEDEPAAASAAATAAPAQPAAAAPAAPTTTTYVIVVTAPAPPVPASIVVSLAAAVSPPVETVSTVAAEAAELADPAPVVAFGLATVLAAAVLVAPAAEAAPVRRIADTESAQSISPCTAPSDEASTACALERLQQRISMSSAFVGTAAPVPLLAVTAIDQAQRPAARGDPDGSGGKKRRSARAMTEVVPLGGIYSQSPWSTGGGLGGGSPSSGIDRIMVFALVDAPSVVFMPRVSAVQPLLDRFTQGELGLSLPERPG